MVARVALENPERRVSQASRAERSEASSMVSTSHRMLAPTRLQAKPANQAVGVPVALAAVYRTFAGATSSAPAVVKVATPDAVVLEAKLVAEAGRLSR